jgi:outer membrane protein assembly factor BamB
MLSTTLFGTLKVAKADNQSSDPNSWPMFRHDPSHTGVSLSSVAAGNQSEWKFRTFSQVASGPAVVDGFVYIGSLDDNVYALNSSTGNEIWNYTSYAPVDSFPAIDNSVVYIGSDDNNVYALNATTGSKIWSYHTGGSIETSPTVLAGVVYVTSTYDGNIYALNATTGSKIWSYFLGGKIGSSPAVVYGTVYVGGPSGKLYALDALTGKSLWNFTTGSEVMSSPAVANGIIYFGSYDQYVYALNATNGNKLWSFETKGAVNSSPAVSNDLIYVGSFDGSVYALNATTGSKVWSYQTGNEVSVSPAVASGMVYIGSTDGNLYALNATNGDKIRAFQVGDPTSSAIADGMVYVGSGDDYVCAFSLFGSLTTVNLDQNITSAVNSVTCTATVSGANPAGTITWKTSSNSGTFSSEVTNLNSGVAVTKYVDTKPGTAFITAIYSGDANNVPSNDMAKLILLNPSLPTTFSVVQSGALNTAIVADNGSEFSVDVRIDNAYAVWAYGICVNWTASALRLVKITEGPFLNSVADSFFLAPAVEIDNKDGTVKGGINNCLLSDADASGSGVLFTLNFEAISPGNANVSIDPSLSVISPNMHETTGTPLSPSQVASATVSVIVPQWTAIDFFHEGKVDGNDFFYFVDAYIQSNQNGVCNAACDLNHDHKIDSTDFFIFVDDYVAYGQWLEGQEG